MPERQQKEENSAVEVKKVEVDYFGENLGGLITKPKRRVKPKSYPASYSHINGGSLGITVALPLYKSEDQKNRKTITQKSAMFNKTQHG
jgi:hypothetical protein